MHTLVDTEHVQLERDDANHLLVFKRKGTRLTLDTLAAAFAPLDAHGGDVDRARWSVLLDLRAAPLNNDPAYEDAMRRHVEKLAGGFRRRALLVKSAVGVLQVTRASRAFKDAEGVSAPEVFRDEQEALAWLKEA